ncbi:MAG: thiamine diphosphokinase [Oscillospiraceae bacterium]|nr:thiamine diphosphokinase [Oscillospiraceae bacterium]
MRAVIISGGRIEDYDYIKKQIELFGAELIICADSGYNHAEKMKLAVNTTVGDFDSLGRIPDGIKIIRYPVEKDCTDTEIALSHARDAGACDFLFIGATGTRADHTLTNIFMLKNCLSRGENAQITDDNNKIRITETKLKLQGEKGTLVSIVPLCDCFGVTTHGLKYPLQNARLEFGGGLGVSNVMDKEDADISVDEGTLLIIEARD